METRIRIIFKVLLLIACLSTTLGCSEKTGKEEKISMVEFCKSNNKSIYKSNKMMLYKLSKDTSNNSILQNVKLLEQLNKDVFAYFNSFRNDFVFKLENGSSAFFDADTIKISQLQNWDNEKFITEYILLSMDSLNSKTEYLISRFEKLPSGKYYFDSNKITDLVNELRQKNNNAFDIVKIIEIIENYYLISVNSIILKIAKN